MHELKLEVKNSDALVYITDMLRPSFKLKKKLEIKLNELFYIYINEFDDTKFLYVMQKNKCISKCR